MNDKTPNDAHAHFLDKDKKHFDKQDDARSHVLDLQLKKEVDLWVSKAVKALEKGDKRTAVPWLQKAADEHDVYALVRLAHLHLEGDGVEKSIDLAMKYFSDAAEQGEPLAMCELASCYVGFRKGASENLPLALLYMKKAYAAPPGRKERRVVEVFFDSQSMAQLTPEQLAAYRDSTRARARYLEGLDAYPDDPARGEQLLLEAVNLGSPAAKARLGAIYRAAGDNNRAIPLLLEAVAHGSPVAQADLIDYYIGQGQLDLAAHFLEKLTKSGNIADPELLAHENTLLALDPPRLLPETARSAYHEGVKIMQQENLQAAIMHFLDAANAGHARAQLLLGLNYVLLDNALPEPPNPRKWFPLAANQGCLEALLHLGVASYLGHGIRKNRPLALDMIHQASRHATIPENMLAGVEWLIARDAEEYENNPRTPPRNRKP